MNVLWHQQEVDIIAGGQSSQPWSAVDLTIRADDVRPGDLFFASPEDNLMSVFEMGAAAAVVPHHMHVPETIARLYPVLKVPCAYEALRALARAARDRTHSVVIAVQGFEQRKVFSRALGAVADYYEGGRHLSSAMAAMPHDCEFSVFSLSPSLRPDIAVIDRPSILRVGNLFDQMAKDALVLINAQDPAYIDVLAQARGAGLGAVMTYGNAKAGGVDISVMERITASNGILARCDVLGQEISVQIPLPEAAAQAQALPLNMLLAALAVAKLSDMNLQQCAWPMGQVYVPTGQGLRPVRQCVMDQVSPNITLMGTAQMLSDEAIFRVKNMIDIGRARKTLILDHAAPTPRERDFALPSRLGNLNVVCATRKASVFKNARKALERLMKGVKLQHIVPDVLTPGDYVVFKSSPDDPTVIKTEALRAHS